MRQLVHVAPHHNEEQRAIQRESSLACCLDLSLTVGMVVIIAS
jgi:hypothetical protein